MGPSAPLPINGDVRLFADSRVDAGGELSVDLGPKEGGLLFTLEGAFEVWNENRESIPVGHAAALPPSDAARSLRVRSEGGGRVLRVVLGPGRGMPVS